MFVAGCSFSQSLTPDDGSNGNEPPIDAPPDVPPDAPDPKCFGSGIFYICSPTDPTGAESLDNDNTIDTTTCNGSNRGIVNMGTPPLSVCMVFADTITLGSGEIVEVSGTRPLVLAAVTSMTLSGSIDASSFGAKLGPGANPSQCGTAGNGVGALNGGGGGAGGTFTTPGGAGGAGEGVAGGSPVAATPTSNVLRGGCKGGQGMPGVGVTATEGGNGGGALYLASRGTITINSNIDASGGGGNGGALGRNGGGGGGSGGMIVFHAETLTIASTARVFANGGGGGGGAGTNDPGDPGADPTPPNITVPAQGGQANTGGRSQGGNGAAGTTNATAGSDLGAGGGGGGGGHGLIRVLRDGISFPAGTASPVPTS